MKVRVLGCSGGINQSVATTSFLIDEDILIDAGTGVCDLSLQEMRQIRHIFVTHCTWIISLLSRYWPIRYLMTLSVS